MTVERLAEIGASFNLRGVTNAIKTEISYNLSNGNFYVDDNNELVTLVEVKGKSKLIFSDSYTPDTFEVVRIKNANLDAINYYNNIVIGVNSNVYKGTGTASPTVGRQGIQSERSFNALYAYRSGYSSVYS